MRNQVVNFIIITFSMVSCTDKEKERHERNNVHASDDVQTEVKQRIANGRTILYFPTGAIKAITHLKDGALEGHSYGFDEDGRVRQIDFYRRGWHNGPAYKFYENHQLASITTYLNDKESGMACTFYPTGAIKTKVNLVNGLANGDFLVFYKNPANHIKRKVEYCIVRGKPYINGDVTYNPSGLILKQSSVLESTFDKAVYRLNEDVRLTIKIAGPQLNKISVTLAPFDSTFYNADSASERTIYGKNHTVIITTKPIRKGTNYVRGYVTDYDSMPTKVPGAIYQTKERDLYFQRKYVVK